MSRSFSTLDAALRDRETNGLYRRRQIIDSPQGVHVKMNDREFINFCSNDYLGLANHPEVIQAFQRGVERFGVGTGSAHLICGHSSAHHALEEELAEFTGRDRALLFSTGYMANLGVISSLLDRNDTVFEDRLNHASLLDGGLFSRARFKRYHHADVQHLEEQFSDASGRSLVVTDGVFSMDGDLAPLPDLATCTQRHQGWIMVDDAHGLGILGNNGGGSLELFQLNQEQIPILMSTLGKALGTFGAFVAGSDELIETLIQTARTYIYTTALPSAVAEATRVSLKIARNESWRRDKLLSLNRRFQQGAIQLGFNVPSTESAIQPLIIGDSRSALVLSRQLHEAGYLISAIRPPTVPRNSARLRITFSSQHEEAEVDRLLDTLEVLISTTGKSAPAFNNSSGNNSEHE